MRYFLSMVMVFALGCSSSPQQDQATTPINESNQTQLHTLKVQVNGRTIVGTGVLSRASSYRIKVFPEDRIEEIVWNTCHQFRRVVKPSSGWFNKTFEFTFTPSPMLETGSSCALKISVLTKDVATDFALLEFQDSRPEVDLNAVLSCDGETGPVRGVAVCQSAAGLRQQIAFRQPVVVNPAPGCDVLKSQEDDTIWTFDIAPNECTYYFVSNQKASNGKRIVFRLRTIGATKFRP